MNLHHVIPAEDRLRFLSCRRAWDFAARERGNREPARPTQLVELNRAIGDALAVYYFPGMWDWAPTIVLPLVRQAFAKSIAARRREYLVAHRLTDLPPDLERSASEREELGLAVIEAYLGWAPTVDEFAPLKVATEIDVQVPDPRRPGRDFGVGMEAVRYRDRTDLLAMDADNGYWMVEHRFVHGAWPDPEAVLRDDRCLSWCWAWEQDNPGLHVKGTIYNELMVDEPVITSPPRGPRSTVTQHGGGGAVPEMWEIPSVEYDLRIQLGDGFRRVHVPRQQAEVAAFGERLADQLREMIDPAIRPYPNPSTTRCELCEFRPPCLALDVGRDAESMLAQSYRDRSHEVQAGTLGARIWSSGRGAAPPTP
ncbi:MAG: hypothetical protein ACRDRK_19030 [Pseudonocardia sp.]